MLTKPYSYYNTNYDYCLIYKEWFQNNMSSSHSHKTYEVYYLTSGKRNFFIKNQLYIANPGSIIFIAPDILHKTTNYSNGPYNCLIINFSPNIFPDYFFQCKDFQKLLECDFFIMEPPQETKDFLDSYVKAFSETLEIRTSSYELKLHSFLTDIVATLTELYKTNEKILHANRPTNLQHTVTEITKYISDHFYEDLTLDKISDKFFISTFHLCRMFKEITGISMHDYINTVRINEAKNVLDNMDIKISNLYKKCGFKSESTFIRTFKSKIGVTPLQYRKKRILLQDNEKK